jgi:uncharacterized membrane protein
MAAEPRGWPRRSYIDVVRGIAVLLMIDAHLFDSWTRFPDRETPAFGWAMLLGGMGTTLFLTLAGVAVALSAGSKLRRTGSPGAASAAVARRGLEIFVLAFVFRFQAWILGWSHSPSDLLKVDVLNIMGPSIVLAAVLWRLGQTAAQRAWIFALATALVAFLTPIARTVPRGFLPAALHAYITPAAGLNNFVFFPWLAMVFGGAVEMVYGLISLPLHRTLSLPVAFGAYVVFCGFMLACSLFKDAAVERYNARADARVETATAQGPTR